MSLEAHGFIMNVGYVEFQHYPIHNEPDSMMAKKVLELALQNSEIFNFAISSPSTSLPQHTPPWSKNVQVYFPILIIRDKFPDSYPLTPYHKEYEYAEDKKKTEQPNQNSNQNLLLL